MAKIGIDQLGGGAALCAWFKGRPSFHDATLRILELRQREPSRLVIHAFKMTSEVDSRGFFVLTRHVVVTLILHELIAVSLTEIREAGITDGLDIEQMRKVSS